MLFFFSFLLPTHWRCEKIQVVIRQIKLRIWNDCIKRIYIEEWCIAYIDKMSSQQETERISNCLQQIKYVDIDSHKIV